MSIDPTALTVVEGQSNAYTVVLTTQPSADVTVTISGHAGTDVSLGGHTLSAETLTFTSVNWNQPQTVTVSAAQDEDAADDTQTVSHAVADGSAAEYIGATIDDVQVTVTDDDAARVSIDPTELTVTEGDATGASYTVVLDSQPTADVTVTISGHAGTDVLVTPSTLTFTSENWETPQTVTVSAAQDEDAAADQAVILTHAASGASEYAAISAGDIPSVTVTIDEHDAAGVSVNPTALTVVEGSTASYTVVLDSQPTADVTVTISGHADTDVTLDKTSLTFTSENWETPQTVTVSAAQDDDAALDQAVTLSHTVSGTGEYQAVTAESVTVTITENDAVGVAIDPTALTVTEGDATGASATPWCSTPSPDRRRDR